jgi:hypothetical protein
MSSPSSHQLHPASVVTSAGAPLRLYGKRIVVRPLVATDFEAWSEVRHRNGEWLSKWEPIKSAYLPDPSTNRDAFNNRCVARDRERQDYYPGLCYYLAHSTAPLGLRANEVVLYQ